ncbi:MAG: LysM peptidoglycan-binding domain-containing M23 family metallopeptidase [Pseudomonadota bacterium]
MIFFPSQRVRLIFASASIFAVVSGCSQGLDYDLRGIGGGFSTAEAANSVDTAQRPRPDDRGVISYPSYQVAVAERGDTIDTVAQRLGLDAPTLARFNGIEQGTNLRQGEVIALPTRVAEPSPATGAAGTGPIRAPGGVDIGALAGDAIDRSANASGEDVRVAALPPSTAATQPQVGTEPIRHKVKRGETAFTISRLYNVPVKSLAEWNGLGPEFAIREGQYLLIPVAQQAPPEAAPPTTITKPGSGSPTPTPPSATQPLPPSEPALVEPVEPAPSVDVGQTTQATNDARMVFPVSGSIIRDYAKGRNEGINIKAEPGTPVKAADAGTVAAITKSADGVPIIVIRHEPELLTVYANVTDVNVQKGTRVTRGQDIAKLRDGNDAYVHFEVRKGFDSVNPMPYLN